MYLMFNIVFSILDKYIYIVKFEKKNLGFIYYI